MQNLTELLKNKRIASVDFGMKRIGVAVTDELHISITPKIIFEFTSENFWSDFLSMLEFENIQAIVIGNPIRKDNSESYIHKEIEKFIEKLNADNKFLIFRQDESLSSKKAAETMLINGTKKKNRKEKGNTDRIAATIILQDFLNENLW